MVVVVLWVAKGEVHEVFLSSITADGGSELLGDKDQGFVK